MFKFGFGDENEGTTDECNKETEVIDWYPSSEVKVPENINYVIQSIQNELLIEVQYDDNVKLTCVSSSEVIKSLRDKGDNSAKLDVLDADGKHSDLVPGKYEGGLKTWECTGDLAQYFLQNVIKASETSLRGKQVLDLGCGSGLLGTLALINGAYVTYQDYNQEVLELVTIPNVFLNIKEPNKTSMRFYSGDWLSFLELLQQEADGEVPSKKLKLKNEGKFDYIVTSETIYNPANYDKIKRIIEELLKDDGVALLAAKSYYFGVGGTMRDFEKHIQTKSNLQSRICWSTEKGVSREILEVKHNTKTGQS